MLCPAITYVTVGVTLATFEEGKLVCIIQLDGNRYNGKHNELCSKSLMPKCPKIGV